MPDKDLKKLKCGELLEILLQQNLEIERLQQELKEAKQQLASRKLAVEEAGSIAEASLKLNGVFEAAQAACQQYIDNVKLRSAAQEESCAAMERAAKEKCDQMITNAQREADAYWEQANQKIQQVLHQSEDLRKLLSL